MNKKQCFTIGGVVYPCRMTMGAMLEFSQRTGKEATEIKGEALSDILILLYCCLLSSCRADGVSLPFSTEMEMADRIMPEDIISWQTQNFSGEEKQTDESKKKE